MSAQQIEAAPCLVPCLVASALQFAAKRRGGSRCRSWQSTISNFWLRREVRERFSMGRSPPRRVQGAEPAWKISLSRAVTSSGMHFPHGQSACLPTFHPV